MKYFSLGHEGYKLHVATT